MQTFCGLTTDGMLDYLAAIYRLSDSQGKVTTSALAEQMHVSAPAASSMLKRLEESRLVERSSVDGVSLTDQGRLAALQLIRRHRLLEVFLVQVMGFTWDQVDSEAHRLEHAVSSAFEDRMDLLCAHPTHCPHGEPIPTKDGRLLDPVAIPLVDLTPGSSASLHRVTARDARVLRYLARLGLAPGCRLRLAEVGPFNGPVTVELLEESAPPERHILGHDLAQMLLVRDAETPALPERRYTAAGGVVIHQGRMLLLDRPTRQEIRLPKGHIDPGEDAAQTALRETAEETGYADLVILADLGSLTSVFDYKGHHYVRDEHYFLMALKSERQQPRSKSDARQFKPIWIDLASAPARLTFSTEQEVARRAIAHSQA